MSLSDWAGHSNTPEIISSLVGEKIIATFQDGEDLVLVMKSGVALVLHPNNGYFAYWVEGRDGSSGWGQRASRVVKDIEEQRAGVQRLIEGVQGIRDLITQDRDP